MKLTARIEFAPDGKNWQVIKRAKHIMTLWDFFVFDKEIRKQLAINPLAKFRLIGESNIVIGELPRQ